MNTVDPAGLRMVDQCPDGLSPPVATGVLEEMFCASPEFNHLARATGGDAMFGYNDVDAQIATTVRDGADFYTLSYRPTRDSIAPGKFRNIMVTVDRPGLTVTDQRWVLCAAGATGCERTFLYRLQRNNWRRTFDLLNADTSRMVYDAVPLTVTASPRRTGVPLPWRQVDPSGS